MSELHTPGPWMGKDGQIYSEADPKGRTHALIPYYDKGNPEQEANARLIAAAPELLEALESALSVIEAYIGNEVINADICDSVEGGRAAIAKAKGQP